MLQDLFNLISNLNLDDTNATVDKIDLSKKEDVEKVHEIIRDFKNDGVMKNLTKWILSDVTDFDEFMDNLDASVDEIHERLTTNSNDEDSNNETEYKEDKSVEKVVIDKSEQTDADNIVERPSIKIDINKGLQIHKLVQEYVDTMIKPYSKGCLSNEQINDAYAGLYEFACWIYNHE